MILTLICWLYIGWIGLSLGVAVNRSILRLTSSSIIKVGPDLLILLGVSSLIVVLGYWYCFGKVALEANLFISAISIVCNLFYLRELKSILKAIFIFLKEQNVVILLIYASFALFVLFASSLSPEQFGTGYYHAQAIQWIEKYKLVPGIANLNVVLGYNNSIYLVSSLFSFSFLGIGSFHVFNGFLIMLTGFRLVYEINKKGERTPIFIGLLLLVLCNYFKIISSSGTDIPISVFMIYLFIYCMDEANSRDNKGFYGIVIVFFLGLTAITIKLSFVILLPFLLFYFYSNYKFIKRRQFLILFFLGIFIMCPWLIRGITISGYALYPYSRIDVCNVSWKVPAKTVALQREFITDWTRSQNKSEDFKNSILDKNVNGIMEYEQKIVSASSEQTSFGWVKKWFKNQSRKQKLVILALLVSLLLYPILLLIKNKIRDKPLRSALFFLNAGIVIWFFAAPDYRFASTLIFLSVLSTFNLVAEIMFNIMKKQSGLSLLAHQNVLMIVVFLFMVMNGYHASNKISGCVIRPYPYKEIATADITGFPVRICTPADIEADFLQCWNAPVPCIPDTVIDFKMRTGKIEDGFIAKQQNR